MNEWISTKEKMPVKDGRYLIYEPRYNWTGVSSLRNGVFDDTTASHWMELPGKPE